MTDGSINWRMEAKKDRWQLSSISKVYVCLVTAECLALLVLETVAIVYGKHEPKETTFMSLVGLNVTCGFFYFALDAILRENSFQLFASVFAHMLITLYSVWQYVYG